VPASNQKAAAGDGHGGITKQGSWAGYMARVSQTWNG